MKKMFAIMIGLMLITSAAFAGGSSSSVPTRYPVVLIHGIAMSDINIRRRPTLRVKSPWRTGAIPYM